MSVCVCISIIIFCWQVILSHDVLKDKFENFPSSAYEVRKRTGERERDASLVTDSLHFFIRLQINRKIPTECVISCESMNEGRSACLKEKINFRFINKYDQKWVHGMPIASYFNFFLLPFQLNFGFRLIFEPQIENVCQSTGRTD